MLTALVLSLSLAAPGDAVYVLAGAKIVQRVGQEVGEPIILGTPEKLELANALASTFPGINPADMDRYYCFARPEGIRLPSQSLNLATLAASLQWRCDAHDGNPTGTTAEDALDYAVDTAGACKLRKRGDGTVFLACSVAKMNSDARILNGAFTESVFDQALNLNWEFLCERSRETPSEISCTHNPVRIADPPAWQADDDAGLVALTLGKVAQ